MTCAICGKRRPRRYCPGVRGEICPVCCGTEREVTVRCPSDCEYLIAAREHEQTVGLNPETVPHRDLGISEEWLEKHSDLIAVLATALRNEANRAGAVDSDAREAIAGLVQSYRTLQSGVIYEAVPPNPLAADIYDAVSMAITRLLELEREQSGRERTRDGDFLRALAFLDILAIDRSNGRRYGRSFLDALVRLQEPEVDAGREVGGGGSSLILP